MDQTVALSLYGARLVLQSFDIVCSLQQRSIHVKKGDGAF